MTPLAQKIVRELTLPLRDRTFVDLGGIQQKLSAAHCFEVSGVLKSSLDLISIERENGATEVCGAGRLPVAAAFLPDPAGTVIEWRTAEGGRRGYFLEAGAEGSAHVYGLMDTACGQGFYSSRKVLELPMMGAENLGREFTLVGAPEKLVALEREKRIFAGYHLYSLLAMINTPRVIGQRIHMPHAGLQKALARAQGMVGKFPLRAWTEVVLEVTPPDLRHGEDPREARLSGAKALHFVRTHLRIRLGRLELVTAHWRGDPALGIKQTRYRVVPPGGRQAA